MTTVCVADDKLLEITGKSIPVCPKVELHQLNRVTPDIDPAVVGCYGYRDGKRHSYRDQYFYLTIDGVIQADRTFKEIDMVVGLGERLEKTFVELGVQVIDVRLPKSHGFSGVKYGFRRTKELFPKAGLPGLRGGKKPTA